MEISAAASGHGWPNLPPFVRKTCTRKFGVCAVSAVFAPLSKVAKLVSFDFGATGAESEKGF